MIRTSDLALRARAELELRARLAAVAAKPRESFGDFICRVLSSFQWYPHVELQVETAQEVVDGKIPRLLVSAPPRYFKSLVWSRLLPAYALNLHPEEWVAVISSSATLAEILSGDAREFYKASGQAFRPDSQDKARWQTPAGGGMWARGVGGWALGVGYNLGIVDDPFAKWEEAMKPGVQEAVETYFWKTFYGRRELTGPRPAAIVINHQRLAEGDLLGRILKREREAKLPSEGWHVLNLPALKRPRREAFPPPVTVIPELARWDGPDTPKRERVTGEPLCPQLQDQDVEGLLRLDAADSLLFGATHQQEPFPDQGGGLFERWWWAFACPREKVAMAMLVCKDLTAALLALMESGDLPILHREGRAWDIGAALAGEGDASASVRGGVAIRRGRQEIVFTHAQEYHYPGHTLPDLIFETAQQDGPGVDVILPQEPAAAGKILIGNTAGTSPGLLQVRLEAAGFRVVVVPTSGSKRVRASPHAGAAMPPRNAQGVEDGRMGRCFILPGEWNDLFCERHQRFDGVTKPLDLVDATAYLFSELDGGSFLTGGIQ
jgi:hypothetical protein